MKDELARNLTTEFFVLRPKTYNYLRKDGNENKEQKAQKSVS